MLGLIISGICTQGAHDRKPAPERKGSAFSTMTAHTAAAVAEGLLDAGDFAPASDIVSNVKSALHKWDTAYRCSFETEIAPACTSAAGLLCTSAERARAAAAAAARALGCTREDACACEAAASAVYLARTGAAKEAVKEYTEREFADLLRRDETEACTKSCTALREALKAFLDGENFRDVLRKCISESCTGAAALACELAEAFYGLPANLACEARLRMPGEVLEVTERLYAASGRDGYCDPAGEKRAAEELEGNEVIAEAIDKFNKCPEDAQLFTDVLEAIRFQMHRNKSLVWAAEYGELPNSIPSNMSVGNLMAGSVKPEKRAAVFPDENEKWFVAFTDQKRCDMCKKPMNLLSFTHEISSMIKKIAKERNDVDGIIINPGADSFCLTKQAIPEILHFENDMYWDVPENMDEDDEEAPDKEKYREQLIRFYADKKEVFAGNRDIAHAAMLYNVRYDAESVNDFVAILKRQIRRNRSFLIPIREAHDDLETNDVPFTGSQLREKILPLDRDDKGREVLPVYTDAKQFHGEDVASTVSYPMQELFRCALEWKDDFAIIINPLRPTVSFKLLQEDIKLILEILEQEKQRDQDRRDGKGPDIFSVIADITELNDVDAIVNCANNALSSKGGTVNEAVHAAAGPKLERECIGLGGCETGMAKLTFAYKLPCQAIIHTVGPRWHGGSCHEEELLRMCYANALQLAASNGLTRIAFPAISTGNNGFPLKKAAEAAIDAVYDFLIHGGYIHFNSIVLVFADKETFDTYGEELKKRFE